MQEASLRADVVHSAPDYVLPKPALRTRVDDNDPDHQVNHSLREQAADGRARPLGLVSVAAGVRTAV